MPRRRHPEQDLQKAVVTHLRARAVPGLCFFHVPNGGKRSKIEAAIFKALGVRAGVPDLLLFHDGDSYALELKAKGGRIPDTQKAMHIEMRDAGVRTAFADSIDEALQYLEIWGLLRPAITMRGILGHVEAAE